MIVLDASAVVELLLNTDAGSRVARRIASPDVSLHAPHVLSIETASALRRLVRARQVTAARAEAAIESLCALDIQRYDHEDLLPRAWSLRSSLTVYDAMYITLAEAIDAPLVTFDTRLARAHGHHAVVEVLGA